VTRGAASESAPAVPKIDARGLNFFYGQTRALQDISVSLTPNVVTAFIGPSGCGKSTFLRTLNRMNDIIPGTRVEGQVLIDGRDIYGPDEDVVQLRRKVGMVFQKSNPFPKSIFENIAYGLRINGMAGAASELADRVEQSLQQAALWSEVKDRLHESALAMSGGQQQRLCIARALAIRPDILLMDEPTVGLDPRSRREILTHVLNLKRDRKIAVLWASHLVDEAEESDRVVVMQRGKVLKSGTAADLCRDVGTRTLQEAFLKLTSGGQAVEAA